MLSLNHWTKTDTVDTNETTEVPPQVAEAPEGNGSAFAAFSDQHSPYTGYDGS